MSKMQDKKTKKTEQKKKKKKNKKFQMKIALDVATMNFKIGDGEPIEDWFSFIKSPGEVDLYWIPDTWSCKTPRIPLYDSNGKQLGLIYLSKIYFAKHGHFQFKPNHSDGSEKPTKWIPIYSWK